MHSASTFLAQVFHRAGIVVCLVALSAPAARAQTFDSDAYSRVFLQNGRALASYGESTLVGDRVAFVVPIGDPRGRVELQLISLPVSAVDLTRTARYAEGARARSYAVTRGASEYSALMADVSLTLAEIDTDVDRARRLATANDLRARLVAWPAAHYNYRAAEVGKVLESLDQLMGDIERDLGQVPSARPPLRPAAPYDAPMPPPTAQESFAMALAAADASADAAARDAIQKIVRSMAGTTATTGAATAAKTTAASAAPRTAAPKAAVPEAAVQADVAVQRPPAEITVAPPALSKAAASPVVVPAPPAVESTRSTGFTVANAPVVLIGLAVLLLAGAAGLKWRNRRKAAATDATSEDAEPRSSSPAVLDIPVSPVVPVAPVVPAVPVVPIYADAALEVGSVRDTRAFGYQFVEGVVRNVSDRTLHFVEVIVDWCAPSGELFARETALIGLDALAPGGTSPFKVLTRANPSMTSYSLMFQSEGATLAQFRQLDRQ